MSQPKVLEPSYHEGGKLKSHTFRFNDWVSWCDEFETTVTSENREALDEDNEVQYLTEFEYAGHQGLLSPTSVVNNHQYDWEKIVTLTQHSIKTSVVRPRRGYSFTTPEFSNFEARFTLPVVGEEIHPIYKRKTYSCYKFTFPDEDLTVKFDDQIYEPGYLYLRKGDNFTPIHKFDYSNNSIELLNKRQVTYILKSVNINDGSAMINSHHINKPKKSKQNSFVLDMGTNQLVSEFTTEGKYMKTNLFPSDEERKEFTIPGRGTIRYTTENEHEYVTVFEVYGRAKKQPWFKIGVFNGNGDRFNEVSHKLEEPVIVKELKFVILNYRGSPSIQVELYQPNPILKPKEPVNKSTVSYSVEYMPRSDYNTMDHNRNNSHRVRPKPTYKIKHLRVSLDKIAKDYNGYSYPVEDLKDHNHSSDEFFDDFDLNQKSEPKYEKIKQGHWSYSPTKYIKFA
jgi:hypothetical protein